MGNAQVHLESRQEVGFGWLDGELPAALPSRAPSIPAASKAQQETEKKALRQAQGKVQQTRAAENDPRGA